jgi:hypothetical protein
MSGVMGSVVVDDAVSLDVEISAMGEACAADVGTTLADVRLALGRMRNPSNRRTG